jgi:hypothetical protein
VILDARRVEHLCQLCLKVVVGPARRTGCRLRGRGPPVARPGNRPFRRSPPDLSLSRDVIGVLETDQ